MRTNLASGRLAAETRDIVVREGAVGVCQRGPPTVSPQRPLQARPRGPHEGDMQGFTHTEEARWNIGRGRGDGGPRSLTSSRTMAWGTAVSDTAIRPANRRANPWLGRDYRVLIAFPEPPKVDTVHFPLTAEAAKPKCRCKIPSADYPLPVPTWDASAACGQTFRS